jgi:transcriptional regulator with XRE-family HTH domain
LDLGLFQRQVAEQIGVDQGTIFNWEYYKSSPQVHALPRVIEFLGYNPLPEPASEPEKLIAARKELGLTQEAVARHIGVDSTTLAKWEQGKSRGPFPKILSKLTLLSKRES